MNKVWAGCAMAAAWVLAGSACGPSPEETEATLTAVAGSVYATLTAEAPTATASLTPTPTATPTPRPSATATLPAVASDWEYHSGEGFAVALPSRWLVIQLGEEGVRALMEATANIDEQWAEAVASLVGSEEVMDSLRFFAMDSRRSGNANPVVTVSQQTVPARMSIADLCTQVPAVFQLLGIEVVDSDCSLRVNGVDGAFFLSRFPADSFFILNYQYSFLSEPTVWTLSIVADEDADPEVEEMIATIRDSFILR